MSQATLGETPYLNSSLFSGYYLDERVGDLEEWDCDEEAAQAFETLQKLWDAEGDLLPSYKEDELLGAWIDEVLDVLGFDTLQETTLPSGGGYNDRLLFDSADARREAARQKRDGNIEGMYGRSAAVLEAKQYGANFTEQFSEQRSYRDASHQIKYYLEHTPERVDWGILTDGKKWRLYGTKDYATETFYEVDLPELLEYGDLAEFKYFYAFFRSSAFRETAGTTFLDTVWNESETAAQELGEDLQDNVFTALRVLGEGFIHKNRLDIDPDDEAARAELKEQSLVLLYRLMFVLYAESRGLIHPDDPDAQDEYEAHFSLDQLRSEIHDDITSGDTFEDYSGHSTQMWGRLQDLFGLIDEGEASLGIPAYNGGLFDDDEHDFLADNEVADRHIAEVIYRLGTTENDDGEFVLADYADLDTRHLGSIYEGLLEHEFRIAPETYAAVSADGGQVWKPGSEVSVTDAVETVEEGELYVVNDDGERKATGAYYTPDYVVSYIVEETVDPLLDDIKADLEADGLEPSDQAYFGRFYRQVQDLKILDPAMGSAHFLTSATAYLTEQVMEVVREQEQQGRDEQEIRRTIAKECIYGVDINGMAVELGKLSMWLETLAADKPLAFLDHHLKAGNSLVGSDITEVLSDEESLEGQITLTQVFARARQQTLEHVMELMQDLLAIDNEDLADIKSMEELYDEIRDDPLYKRLFEVANVHTAEEFGLDVPEGVYEEMAGAIEDADDWAEMQDNDWFRSAQAMASEKDFFHWELEFPEVFFGEGGEKLDDTGFDAVVGNPPYMRIQTIRNFDEAQVDYLNKAYEVPMMNYDIYAVFAERGHSILSQSGELGYILPSKFIQAEFGEGMRDYISQNSALRKLVDMGHTQVFESATTYTCLLFLSGDGNDKFGYTEGESGLSRNGLRWVSIKESQIGSEPWLLLSPEEKKIIDRMDDEPSLSNISETIFVGIQTSKDSVYALDIIEKQDDFVKVRSEETGDTYRFSDDFIVPYLKGEDVSRYSKSEERKALIFPYFINEDSYRLASPDEIRGASPNVWEYLLENKEVLKARDGGSMDNEDWYGYTYPKSLHQHGKDKILTPEISNQCNFTIDTDSKYSTSVIYSIISSVEKLSDKYLLGVLNSGTTWYYISNTSHVLRGGYYRFKSGYLSPVGIPDIDFEMNEESRRSTVDTVLSEREKISDRTTSFIAEGKEGVAHDIVVRLVEDQLEYTANLESLNLSLQDHLGTYSDGQTLADIGLTQPPKGSADSILQETAEEKPNLRVGEASVNRESDTTVEIRLTARYKPDDEDAHETDQWGYTETDPLPALRITDLTPTEADLIEAFVPVAVDEAGGFAGFRETATKTNSLVDRLRGLTLPAVDDVRDGLQSYTETVERADELEAKIEQTDDLIDEIVYELYGLTDEEIAIVEEAVGE